MIFSLVLSVTVLYIAITVHTAPSPSRGFFDDVLKTRIMFGEEAEPGQFPHQLSVVTTSDGTNVCGATLVHETHALSSARCFDPATPENYMVRAGQHTQGQPKEVYGVLAIENHEDFDEGPGTFAQDICILYMAVEDSSGSPDVKPIRIAREADGQFTGKTCTISGWGTTESESSASNLQYANITVITNEECQNLMESSSNPVEVIDSMICVYNGDSGSCKGDGGSPLTCPSDSDDVVAGLKSWHIEVVGGGRCLVNFPTVHTRVSSFEDWIDQRIPGLP